MKTYAFEKLDVWQKSRVLAREMYALSKSFPDDERYGITQQLRRASISVSCNLAEGTSRVTGKEQARFSEIAFASLMEVLNLLILANDLGYLSARTLEITRPSIDEISNKINALRIAQMKNC